MLVNICMVALLTAISGFGDAKGFVHGSEVWNGTKLSLQHFVLSLSWFAAGILAYLMALRFLGQIKTYPAEVQTMGWFIVTIIGVALFSGSFIKWQRIDQIIAIFVVLGLVWLLMRIGG